MQNIHVYLVRPVNPPLIVGSEYPSGGEERLEYQPFVEDAAAIDQRLGKVCDSGTFTHLSPNPTQIHFFNYF